MTARRKKLRRLEKNSALNVGSHLSFQSDTKELQIQKPMKKLINMYILTFSVDL